MPSRWAEKFSSFRVAPFPKHEEIPLSSRGLGFISRQDQCSRKLQVRQGTDWIVDYDPAMVENLLKFRRGLCTLMQGQVCLAANINRVKPAVKCGRWDAQFVRDGGLQEIQRFSRIAVIQGKA